MASLNKELSIWITEKELGTVRSLNLPGRSIQYRVPKEISDQVTLRFKGYGNSSNGETGDVLLLIRVNRGQDVEANVWLSETEAQSGCLKSLHCNGIQIYVRVPADSKNQQVIRVPNAGNKLPYRRGLPLLGRKRGSALVTLRVFPERIVPQYRNFENLGAQELSLEGWIYRRYDGVLEKLGNRPHTLPAFSPSDAANLFNVHGWRGIADALVERLSLRFSSVDFKTSNLLSVPGQCQIEPARRGHSLRPQTTIIVRDKFLGDPFAVTAILSHELCHLVERRIFPKDREPVGAEVMEMERTVDLLVFLYRLGEFQMRVARDRRMTLGYFNQELFERMYVILSRKRDGFINPRRVDAQNV